MSLFKSNIRLRKHDCLLFRADKYLLRADIQEANKGIGDKLSLLCIKHNYVVIVVL